MCVGLNSHEKEIFTDKKARALSLTSYGNRNYLLCFYI